jgi:hypothetical protein
MYWQELRPEITAAQFYYQSNGDINKAKPALEMSAENHFIFTPEIIDFSEARR